jgi:hypothetical protein
MPSSIKSEVRHIVAQKGLSDNPPEGEKSSKIKGFIKILGCGKALSETTISGLPGGIAGRLCRAPERAMSASQTSRRIKPQTPPIIYK